MADRRDPTAALDELLARALEDPQAIEAYLAAGPAVVTHLDRHLHERAPLRRLAIDGRAGVDAVAEVTDRVGRRFPEETVACFGRRAGSGLATVGLGATGRDDALDPVLVALDADDEFTRMDGAIALGRLPTSARSRRALVAVLDDPAYLVRYHALRSLAVVGGADALDRLDAMAASAEPPEDDLAREAIDAIRTRM